jgi:hypothetical protein
MVPGCVSCVRKSHCNKADAGVACAAYRPIDLHKVFPAGEQPFGGVAAALERYGVRS